MKSSYQWLQNYVSITVSAEEIADNLTRIGLEAEQIRSYNQFSNSIVIAEILQRKKHPNADHLSLCEVNDGSISPLQVVCGAPNCDSGKKAVFARIGSVLPGGFKLKKRKIRGEYSYGMLCSGQELAIDDNDEDLFILPDDARPGSQLTDYIKGDTIIDWDVTPNRPDCLSHIGIAREIAAITNKPLQIPEPIVEEIGSDKIKEQLTVSVEASRLCTRYHARLFTDVKIGPSPLWMQNDLRAIGLRPINNIVDISNFVLMECGQPLHAFDVGKISGDRIVVRNARECETIRALDEKTYTLSSEDLIIADASKPVALAGIMGGENSAITPDTSSILLESANFRPDAIRKTCKRLGVRSDSSYRFERGIDPEKLAFASRRAAELIIRYAGAKLLPGSIDIVSEDPPKPIEIRIRIERAKRLLGIPIDPLECMTILQSLGLELIEKASDSFTIRVPSHRLDLKTEIDLIEEITRLHGLDKIPISSPTAISGGGRRDDSYYSIQTIHEELIQLGLTECIHSSFLDRNVPKISGIPYEAILGIRNPIDQGERVMRPSLLPSMLKTVDDNRNHGNHTLALFELGKVMIRNGKEIKEENQACIILTGHKHPEPFSEEKKILYDIYDLRGLIDDWLKKRRIDSYIQSDRFGQGLGYRKGYFHPAFTSDCTAVISLDKEGSKPIIYFGKINQLYEMEMIRKKLSDEDRINEKLMERESIRQVLSSDDGTTEMMREKLMKKPSRLPPLYAAIVKVDQLMAYKAQGTYKPLPVYPAISRDLAFVANDMCRHQDIINVIQSIQETHLEQVELFDVYQSEAIGTGKKSMAYSLRFRSSERTLTDEEVNKTHEAIKQALKNKLVDIQFREGLNDLMQK